MQEISNVLVKNGLLFSKLEPIPLKILGSKKKVECFFGVTTNKEFGIVFVNFTKSRILQKELDILEELTANLELLKNCKMKKKILLLKAPICSKALNKFKKYKWRVLHVLV